MMKVIFLIKEICKKTGKITEYLSTDAIYTKNKLWKIVGIGSRRSYVVERKKVNGKYELGVYRRKKNIIETNLKRYPPGWYPNKEGEWQFDFRKL